MEVRNKSDIKNATGLNVNVTVYKNGVELA